MQSTPKVSPLTNRPSPLHAKFFEAFLINDNHRRGALATLSLLPSDPDHRAPPTARVDHRTISHTACASCTILTDGCSYRARRAIATLWITGAGDGPGCSRKAKARGRSLRSPVDAGVPSHLPGPPGMRFIASRLG